MLRPSSTRFSCSSTKFLTRVFLVLAAGPLRQARAEHTLQTSVRIGDRRPKDSAESVTLSVLFLSASGSTAGDHDSIAIALLEAKFTELHGQEDLPIDFRLI